MMRMTAVREARVSYKLKGYTGYEGDAWYATLFTWFNLILIIGALYYGT